jgi:cellulose 1,4-beta-cellobiosidase
MIESPRSLKRANSKQDAGLGIRPTIDTSNCIVDSIVWVKPPGQSDGTSDQSSARFDTNCVSDDAFVPSPEAGSWNNDYVEMLVKNANPPVEPAYW